MKIVEMFTGFFQQVFAVLLSFKFSDFLDILFVAFIVYHAIKLVRETRAVQLLKGVFLFAFVYVLITAFEMQASIQIFRSIASNAIIVMIILFTPEIRHALESLGRTSSSLSSIGLFAYSKKSRLEKNERTAKMITDVCRASSDMSDKRIGALMVFEKETMLGEIIKTGTTVDAVISEQIIGNIFFPKSPLHDGAAIIRESRVVAAGCILPLTGNALSKELGTRHRAAVGMSEESDCIVVVVSEETGAISVAHKGNLNRDISSGELREILSTQLIEQDNSPDKKLSKLFGRKK